MKKQHILFSFLFTLAVISAGAQCKYGPRLAVGLSSLGGGNSGIAVQAGLFVNAELKDRMGIQGEVLYGIKNGNKDFTQVNSTGDKVLYTTKYSFTYIDVPIYGYVPLSKHITFLAGPLIGIVNKATERLTGPNVTGEAAEKRDIADTDAKLGFAAGLDFNMASPVRFGLRFATNGGDPFTGKSSFVGVTMAYYMDW
jgi:hypothetical protein